MGISNLRNGGRLRRSLIASLLVATTLSVAPVGGVSAQDDGDTSDGPAGSTVQLVDNEFGRYLEVQPNVNVYSSNQSNTATEWVIRDGGDDSYIFESVSTGLYLDADGDNVVVSGEVSDDVRWNLEPLDDGSIRLTLSLIHI